MTTIYGLCDPETGEVRYIGATRRRPAQRLKSHMAAAKRGDADACCVWKRSLKRRPTIKPFIVVPDAAGAEAERQVIAVMRANGARLLNESDGGPGVPGYQHKPESIAKLSAAHRGRKKSPEAVARQAATLRGRKLSPELCAKIANAHRGKAYRPRTKPMGEQARANIAAAHRGLKHSPETREKIRQAAFRRHANKKGQSDGTAPPQAA